MIDGLVAGRLMGDASRRVDKAGRPFMVARVLARNKADEEFIVNVIAFDDAACAALRALAELVSRFVTLLEREDVARGTARLAAMIEAGAALIANLRERRDTLAEARISITQAPGDRGRHCRYG